MGPASKPQDKRYACVLTIAGSDSGGGAGIQADLKTFAALGCYGMSAITAITAQNTLGVRAIEALPPAILAAQIDAVAEDIGVHAVKIGMLRSAELVRVVADAVRRHRFERVVLDPVMVATSGDRLIAEDTLAVLVRELFPLATLITPNLDEAGWLLQRRLADAGSLEHAARALQQLGARAVLLKGGHLPGDEVVDLLLDGNEMQRWQASRIDSRNTHGTGCTLSSAIACGLALGHTLREAVAGARAFVRAAMESGADVRVGGGHGALNHGFAPIAAIKCPTRIGS